MVIMDDCMEPPTDHSEISAKICVSSQHFCALINRERLSCTIVPCNIINYREPVYAQLWLHAWAQVCTTAFKKKRSCYRYSLTTAYADWKHGMTQLSVFSILCFRKTSVTEAPQVQIVWTFP